MHKRLERDIHHTTLAHTGAAKTRQSASHNEGLGRGCRCCDETAYFEKYYIDKKDPLDRIVVE